MTEELRLVLLLGGILIFGYIIWDAKRRQKKEPSIENSKNASFDSKTEKPATLPKKSVHDAEGYDDLGLTQARVVNGPDLPIEEASTVTEQPTEIPEIERVEPSFDDEPTIEVKKVQSNDEETEDVLLVELDDHIVSTKADEKLQDSSNLENMQKPETVITINIMANGDDEFPGSNLLQEFLTLGFKYGEMGVFHRYQNANGQGERWFCLANAINPGSFDLDKMDDFTTPGLTLFMLLPGPQKPLEAFENMLNAANKLQSMLGGKLEDGSHSALTQQRIQHYREEILNFQRKHLAKINHSDETE